MINIWLFIKKILFIIFNIDFIIFNIDIIKSSIVFVIMIKIFFDNFAIIF